MLIIDKEIVDDSPTAFANKFETNNTIHQMRGRDRNKFRDKLLSNRPYNKIQDRSEYSDNADSFHTDDLTRNKLDRLIG